MISLILNTAALGPKAQEIHGSDGRYGPHALRVYALRNFILPAYCANRHVGEVIVVGEWEEGPGYTYIHVPSVHFSSADALAQRQAGFDASTGDTLIFQHDDHVLSPGWWSWLDNRYDVISPARYTRLRNAYPERLNNGEGDFYVSGHCAVYRRSAIERCPWNQVPPVRMWDIEHTKRLHAAGCRILWSADLTVLDVEYGSAPWR